MSGSAVSSADMVAKAMAEVLAIDPAEAAAGIVSPDFVFIDVRDVGDWTLAHIPGAVNAPRGMLEFYIDPVSSFHLPVFNPKPGRQYVFYCGSGARSALSARLAGEMGLDSRYMTGGFRAWREASLPVERAPDSPGNTRRS